MACVTLAHSNSRMMTWNRHLSPSRACLLVGCKVPHLRLHCGQPGGLYDETDYVQIVAGAFSPHPLRMYERAGWQDTTTPVNPTAAMISVATATTVPTVAAVPTAAAVPIAAAVLTAAVTIAPTVASEPTAIPAMPANTPERSEEEIDVVEKAGDAGDVDSQESAPRSSRRHGRNHPG